jgi:hypothetical protein
VARSWTSGYLYRRNPETNKPEYCLMGVILRSCGVTKEQMDDQDLYLYNAPGKFSDYEWKSKSKVQKIIEWSQFPKDAKVAMKALAIVILEEAQSAYDTRNDDPELYYEGGYSPYTSDYWWRFNQSGASPEAYVTANPEEIPNIIAEHNDNCLRNKQEAKALILKALND